MRTAPWSSCWTRPSRRATSPLADTVNQNPVLKKAGVVDAGGKGFLVILQGMLDELQGEPMPVGTEDEAPSRSRSTPISAPSRRRGTNSVTAPSSSAPVTARRTLRPAGFLSALGDSLVLVDDDEIIKVHVHTNHPGKVLEEAITYGSLQTVKIEKHAQSAH